MCRLLAIACTVAWLAVASTWARTTVNANDRYSYASNAGWLNWQGDVDHGAVFQSRFASGYIHSANLGWIHLGDGSPTNTQRYSNTSANDCGVNIDATSSAQAYLLSGYAYGANIGWINFDVASLAGEVNRPRIDKQTGILQGYVWGTNIGWIALESTGFAQVRVQINASAEDWAVYQ